MGVSAILDSVALDLEDLPPLAVRRQHGHAAP